MSFFGESEIHSIDEFENNRIRELITFRLKHLKAQEGRLLEELRKLLDAFVDKCCNLNDSGGDRLFGLINIRLEIERGLKEKAKRMKELDYELSSIDNEKEELIRLFTKLCPKVVSFSIPVYQANKQERQKILSRSIKTYAKVNIHVEEFDNLIRYYR